MRKRRMAVLLSAFLMMGVLPVATAGAAGHECGDPFTAIYDLQGSGSSSLFHTSPSTVVTTEGVVSLDLQKTSEIRGFFLQDPDGDGDSATSDGLFVFQQDTWDGGAFDVSEGDHIRITGELDENFGDTEIENTTEVLICGSGKIKPLKLKAEQYTADTESLEGMLVQFKKKMAVTDTFNLHRFGEIWLTEKNVSEQPTNQFAPGTKATDLANRNMARSILLDDASRFSNPSPIPFLRKDDTLRLGDTTKKLTGAVYFSFGNYKLEPAGDVDFKAKNKRKGAPDVDGDLIVASANVLNYWTTIGCGFPCRGAQTPAQLTAQTDKLVAMFLEMDADVIALQEMENDPTHLPITTLVAAMNAAEGSTVWAWVGPVATYNSYPIRNEIVYRIGAVTPLGGPVTIVDPAFDTIPVGRTTPLGRPPVAQSFMADGETFTVMVNHFKSKSCSGATGLDLDQGDGQSCHNAARVAQAERVLVFVDDLIAATGDKDVLVVGDMNAYLEEDPIHTLEGDLKNLVSKYEKDPYSFNFFASFAAPWIGRGLLDHAFGTKSMSKQVEEVRLWHVNADEPRFQDWFDPTILAPGPFRASDHDPVIIGLELDD